MNINPAKCARVILLVCVCTLLTDHVTEGHEAGPEWRSYSFPFKVLNTTANGNVLWICGTQETIAVSPDQGGHWEVKHQAISGAVLLNIAFVDDKFGYAAGTGGVFLTTDDGGTTWVQHSAGRESILQASFSDPHHGLIRTPTSLLFTDDGLQWSNASSSVNSDDLKRFPYTFSLVALDGAHMAVMLKQGAAQYESQELLFTQDSGKTWKLLNIPNVTLYSFLRVRDQYWAVGTEVIHKDQPGGGHGVPVALVSPDGEHWNHSNNDLSECKLRMCTVCTPQGCLSSNGVITRPFFDKTAFSSFVPNDNLSPKWAATDSTICSVGHVLECAPIKNLTDAPTSTASGVPTVVSPAPLGSPIPTGPQCILCEMDRLFIDSKVQGAFEVKLALTIDTHGAVTGAEAQSAPTTEIKSRIEQQAQQWVFEPFWKDGAPVNVKLNTKIHITVIKSR